MGITKVPLLVKNPAKPKKVFFAKFLVDSGATHTVVPSTELKKLGIRPQGTEDFLLADGKIISRKVGTALFEYKGIERGAAKYISSYLTHT